MRTFEIQGRLINVGVSPLGGSFVIEVLDGWQPQYISFNYEKSLRGNEIDSLEEGATISVEFEIRGTENEGSFFTVLQAQSVILEKKFKYQSELESHNLENCPPSEFTEIEKECFRFVFDDITHPNNFKPVFLINPQRINDAKDYTSKCHGFGVSLFMEEGGAKAKYARFMAKSNGNFAKVVGNCLAVLALEKDDGVGSESEYSNFSHFTFHEYSSADLSTKVIRHYKI